MNNDSINDLFMMNSKEFTIELLMLVGCSLNKTTRSFSFFRFCFKAFSHNVTSF